MRKLFAALPLLSLALLFPSPVSAAEPTVRVDRLERLATHLETRVDASRFSMATWGSTDDVDDPNYRGCAAGFAVQVFRADGFTLDGRHPAFEGRSDFNACSAFFGLSSDDAQRLFGAVDLRSPTDEARVIRNVIARERLRLARLTPAPLCSLAAW